jgi:uncharacterized protein
MAQPGTGDEVRIEPIYVIEASCSADAAERRVPFRPEHLRRLARLRDEGVVVEAGAFADVSASLVLVRAADEAAAMALARDDVYVRGGVWTEIRVRPFGRIVRPVELTDEPG